MKATNTLFLVVITGLAGCASNSGAMKIGPQTYQVTASRDFIAGGAASAQASAMKSATEQCASEGRELLLINTSTGFERPHSRFSATFRCLDKNDPTLRRPNMQQRPDVVIEDRRQQ